LILQGRVSVDGQVVRQLGTRVDSAVARVTVDGEPIRLETTVYFAVNKPKGYVSTNADPSGRPRVVDLLPEIPERVYAVGRLDEDSTGLMILTNDGELANRLAHPRYGVEKTYRALVAGIPGPELVAKLTEGVWLSDGKVRAKRARIVGRQGQAAQLELVLAEGKKREIRRMLSKLGHKVMSLTRIAMGPITLKGLPVGDCRPLSRHEVELLRKVAAGIAIATRRPVDGNLSDGPRTRHSHSSNRRRRAKTDGSSPQNRPAASQAPGPRRFRERGAPAGARPGHLQGRHAPASEHAPPADRAVPRERTTKGSAGSPPAQPAGSKRTIGLAPPGVQEPRTRRIIGLEPETPIGGRHGAKGRSIPKQPPRRKPRLRRPERRPLRASPNKIDEIEGEDSNRGL